MKKKLTNNWLLKIISAIGAVLLWMVVINIDNPTDTFTVSGIPVTVLNEQSAIRDNNLTYELMGDQTVSVEVTARRTDRRKISADDFEASIDMNEIYGATGSVAVKITVVNNKSLIRSWTQITRSIKVNVEEMQTKEFEIQVAQNGEPADSYAFSEIAVSPSTVRVTAPKSVMDTIDHAGINVDVAGASDDIQAEGTIRLLKANGQEIDMSDDRISVSASKAEVIMTAVKTNQISVDVKVTGQNNVAEGYKYINFKCDPQTILVTGAKSLIAELDNILEVTVDLTGADKDVVRTVKVSDLLPEGLNVADGQPDTINIVFQIEKLTQKSFRISKNQLSMTGASPDFGYRLGNEDAVTVVLTGLSEDLEKVNNSDLFVTLDVSSIDSPGTYELEPQVEITDEYKSYFTVTAARVEVTVTSLTTDTESSEESRTETSSEASESVNGTESTETTGTSVPSVSSEQTR
ncbi:hypothetical protein LQE92_05895 [Lacrimispora sp. NSJ-141]|uniref:YbbR domain-containing protein n=1 Tax=Lientehia hominis TaxID=2897778 RepID=A0AAP2W9V1_9FIRM|nr:CdaR family protein [Lientehia hominis]MCD2492159.1 hypothetical protein [Lientehia hominis]